MEEEKKPAFVYMLRCNDGSLYTGWTFDPDARLRKHNEGKGARYTRMKRPCERVFLLSLPSRAEAMKLEALIKKRSRDEKEKMILCPERAEELLR